MDAIISALLVHLILATFRTAELGFFGALVYTREQTPCFCGQAPKAGFFLVIDFFFLLEFLFKS